MKWHGRRQSTNVEDAGKWKPDVKALAAIFDRDPKTNPPKKPKQKSLPYPTGDDLNGYSDLAMLRDAARSYFDKQGERGRREGWMDAKYSKKDDNWKHSNFRKGGKVCSSGKHVDYGSR